MTDRVADLLLLAAAKDIRACRVLSDAQDIDDSVVGFHAQQACEKCLKAVLSAASIEFRRTHDLLRLIALLEDNGHVLPSAVQGIDALNPYAVEGRYGLVEAGHLDRAGTLAAIDAMYAWARDQIDPPLRSQAGP